MSHTILYTLSVTITDPVDEDDDPADYITLRQRRHMEREVISLLEDRYGRKTVDAEVMETEIKETA